MNQRRIVLGVSALFLMLTGTRGQTADQILIAAGSGWRYNDSGANLGTAWRMRAYNDASWLSGTAQLGYGDGDESTIISYGSDPANRRITYYFRSSFAITDPSEIASLAVRFIRDDGCVIYVNGIEVARSNMPSGAVTYTTRASVAIGGADESAWLEAPIDPCGTGVRRECDCRGGSSTVAHELGCQLRSGAPGRASPASGSNCQPHLASGSRRDQHGVGDFRCGGISPGWPVERGPVRGRFANDGCVQRADAGERRADHGGRAVTGGWQRPSVSTSTDKAHTPTS